jgi:cytochrome o ubiquinol oxidase subunit II
MASREDGFVTLRRARTIQEITLQATRNPRNAWRASLLAVSCAFVTSCDDGVLGPKGPVGRAEKLILFDATAIMLAVVIPVIVLTLAFAWWYRAGNTKARYRPDWEYSGRLEMITWSIPALIVMFLGGMAWIGSHDLDPPRPLASKNPPLEVDVVSMDWKWLFIYPGQKVGAVNELVVPVNTPIDFHLTSSSVMNSFFIPQLGSQIYAMAGMKTRLMLQADVPGVYIGRSAQFSGDGFSDMQFNVRAVSKEEFDKWVAQAQQQGSPLDRDSYTSLLKPSHADAPRTFSSVDPGLFDFAMMATTMPAKAEGQ